LLHGAAAVSLAKLMGNPVHTPNLVCKKKSIIYISFLRILSSPPLFLAVYACYVAPFIGF
jgi:hypothetical protein